MASSFSAARWDVLYSIQERKTTVMDVSTEAVVASNEKKEVETNGRREEKPYKYTVMNVLVRQRRSWVEGERSEREGWRGCCANNPP